MRLCRSAFAVSLAVTGSIAAAQSAREQAVAIDRVPVQPPDMMEAERIGPVLNSPWSIAFLPDGRMIVTEKHGGIRIIGRDGTASEPLPGGPANVLQRADSGLLDIMLDPDFAANGLVYVAFAEGTEAANRTAIWRGRLDGGRFVSGRVIFRVNQAKQGPGHPGGRMLFLPDNTLLLTVGDGYRSSRPRARPGEPSRQGAAPHPRRSHAPRQSVRRPGGLCAGNLDARPSQHSGFGAGCRPPARSGATNMARAAATRSMSWNPPATMAGHEPPTASTMTARSSPNARMRPMSTGPRLVWAPSIAPSGLAVYHGALFPELEGRLLVGGLAARSIVQVRINPQNGLLAEESRRLASLGLRIRDIRVAPDGNIYWLSDGEQGGLFRILPPGERLLAAVAGRERSIRDLAFLLGSWTGESRFLRAGTPAAPAIAETSRTSCRPALRGRYIECLTTFSRTQGRGRDVLSFYVYNPETRRLESRVQDSNWGGITSIALGWDEGERAWVGLVPTRDPQGRPATERVVIRLSADGNALEHSELLRVDGSEQWTETFRWTMRRGQ